MIWTFSGPAALHAVPTPLHSSCATAALQNVVQYTGSAADREIIRQLEFNLPSRQQKGRMRRYKFNVLLTSYETLLRDKRVFMVIWRTTPWLASATCFEVPQRPAQCRAYFPDRWFECQGLASQSPARI